MLIILLKITIIWLLLLLAYFPLLSKGKAPQLNNMPRNFNPLPRMEESFVLIIRSP